MVAYSFNNSLADQVAALTKLQTVRKHRKRHARVGEPVQLFTGMRTRACRKLVDPDPICVGVDEIEIRFVNRTIDSLSINGIPLEDPQDFENFAIADGFAPSNRLWPLIKDLSPYPASYMFTRFWASTHPGPVFDGNIIRWLPVEMIADAPEPKLELETLA